ncbi:MAG: beta-ketoadipyl CoA thiolase [Bdellovibrionales bacterium GWA2_49_15]|nr:MAG: beta-ketoadipyl CoA thiolase [Bdellovibrionales bacterium GWA2_49_15]
MSQSYIVWARRTPMGKLTGSLASVRTDDLLSLVFEDFKKWAPFDLKEIDDVVVGCANQAGEDNRNVGRMGVILAGFPFEVPAATVNRLCGSSLEALTDAFAKIEAKIADCVLVGGVESMSRGPYVLSKAESEFDRGQKMYDSSFGWRFQNPKMAALFPLMGMGETAEEVATLHNISREDQDRFAMNSHQKAAAAYQRNLFQDELIPVKVQKGKESLLITRDECVREDSSFEKLQKLKPVFRPNGSVTAGNSSPMNDGASGVLVVSEKFLKQHNLKPLLKITGAASRGLHPNVMGLGPVVATQTLCQRYGMSAGQFDVVELNEAFAAQSLACMRELKLDPEKVNIRGGAIALGHPLGCSGARLVTTLAHIMKQDAKLKRGLASMCVGVGQGISLAVENCL